MNAPPSQRSARAALRQDMGRQNLLLARALELVSRGDLDSARRLLERSEEKDVSLDQVFGMYHDELRSQAEQLRDSQQRAEQALGWFAQLFRGLPVAAVMLDSQGQTVDANARAVDELGLDAAVRQVPVLMRRMMATADGELRLQQALKRLDEEGEATLDRVHLRSLRGRERVVDLRLSRLPPRDGDHGGPLTLCMIDDRTAEAEAQRAREATVAAERQRDLAQAASQAKTQLLSRLSHELRTPLNAVLGFSSLLLLDAERLDAEQRRRVGLIQDAGKHLLELVEDVLRLNRSNSGALMLYPQAVNLHELVHEVLALQQPDIERRELSVYGSLGQPRRLSAWADPRRLREVLTNLVSNAVKYNRRGGDLELCCGAEGSRVFASVRDSGIGLTDDQREHLFEPFNRLGAEHGGEAGHGLGLSIAQTLAQAMGGRIEVRSIPGEGSRFTLWLPASPG